MVKTLLDRSVQIRLTQLGERELPTSAAMNDMAEVLLYQREVSQAKHLLDIAVGLRHSMLGIYCIFTYCICIFYVCMYMCVYMYVYVYVCICLCIWVCINRHRHRHRRHRHRRHRRRHYYNHNPMGFHSTLST